jgi:hypothetical protein
MYDSWDLETKGLNLPEHIVQFASSVVSAALDTLLWHSMK